MSPDGERAVPMRSEGGGLLGPRTSTGMISAWTGRQLAARLLALNGVAPEPVEHVLFRETSAPAAPTRSGYCVPGCSERLDQPAFLAWLAKRTLAGADQLAVGLLILRERLDADGFLQECVLERRRGAVDGPFAGDPARVDFVGAAERVRLYRVQRNGSLKEVAGRPDGVAPMLRDGSGFSGDLAALQTWFGPGVRVAGLREATVLEEMAGFSTVAHVVRPDGRESAGAIGWFGTRAYVVEGAFPRLGARVELAPEDAEATMRVLREHDLVGHEVRADPDGLCLIARQRGGLGLFRIGVLDGVAELAPYHHAAEAGARPDQLKWIRYAERVEQLTILDSWREGAGMDLMTLTGASNGEVWRHAIDPDGVELWRRLEDEAAMAVLHRERLQPGSVVAWEAGGLTPRVAGGEIEPAGPERPRLSAARLVVPGRAGPRRGGTR